MERIKNGFRRFLREEDGAAVAEYGLLLAIVAIGLIAVLATFKDELGLWWGRITTALTTDPQANPAPPAP